MSDVIIIYDSKTGNTEKAAGYVLEGKGIIEIGDERMEAAADTIIESPAKIPHRWLNESQDILRVLVIKLPRPTENTIVL